MHKCIASSDSSKSTIELLLTKPHTMEDKEALLASYLNHPSKLELESSFLLDFSGLGVGVNGFFFSSCSMLICLP